MNRPLSALFAAIDAFIAVAIGVGIPVLVSTLLWAFHFGLAIEWTVFWRAAADVWLLGNGVPIDITLDPALAAAIAVPGAGEPFALTMALCGFALITVLLGRRSGVRLATTSDHQGIGALAGVVSFSALSTLIAWAVSVPGVQVSALRAAWVVPAVYGTGVLVGVLFPGQSGIAWGARLGRLVRDRVPALPDWLGPALATGARMGAMAASAIVALSAVAVTAALLLSFAQIVALYEAAQSGILGGLSVTVLQLALLPNLVSWAASWFIGPGFALGVGTLVSPLDTHLGPLPGLPILGAIPHDTGIGVVGVLLPLAAAFGAGALLRDRWRRSNRGGLAATLTSAAVAGLAAGGLLGVFALWSAGSAGPGRLGQVGPDAALVALFAALEVFAGVAGGLLAPLARPRGVRRVEHKASGPSLATPVVARTTTESREGAAAE